MSIWTSIESVFEPAEAQAQAFVHEVATDFTGWLKKEETVVVADWKAWWGAQKALWTKYSMAQITILAGLVNTAKADLAAGDISGIVAAVIAQATTAETAWISQLGADELAALVAALVAALAYKAA